MKKIGIPLLLAAIAGTLLAQEDNYNFSHVDINKGLSHNQVNCFLKDKQGFLWIGTMSGLNRFDGVSIKVFRHEPRDTSSIRDNYVSNLSEGPDEKIWIRGAEGYTIYDPAMETFYPSATPLLKRYGVPDSVTGIFKDRASNFWFSHASQGIFKLARGSDRAKRIELLSQGSRRSPVSSIASGANDILWVIHQDGLIEELNGRTDEVLYQNDYLPENFGTDQLNYYILCDADNDLWIYCGKDRGVFFFDVHQKKWTHFDRDSKGIKLNTNIIRGIAEGSPGLIWIATDHGGINLINKKNGSVQYLLHREGDDRSLAQNTITTLYKDTEGIVWLGTYKKGFNFYHENSIRFPLYRHWSAMPSSLPYDDVNRFVEDDKGNLWIGTNGGGLIYFDRKANSFKQYLHNSGANSVSNDVIVSLCIDHKKHLWIGTYFGGLDRFDGKRFVHYRNNPADAGSISDNSVWEIFEDREKNLWVGTLSSGLNLYDPIKDNFSHYRSGEFNSIKSNYISAITEDNKGNLLIGTSVGLEILKKENGRFAHYQADKGDPKSLSNDGVLCILVDRRGLTWIGTNDGLNLFDAGTNSSRIFRKEDGLPDNTILTLLEDDAGNLWASTHNGISNILVPRGMTMTSALSFKTYDEYNGLQGKLFNENAALKTHRGELIFGGANGFNIIRPQNIKPNQIVPTVVLTNFLMMNRNISAGEKVDGHVILKNGITTTREVTLAPNQNVFSIEFAAPNYFNPEKIKYKYILVGFTNKWLTADSRSRNVTYTNLDPGDYEFKVTASDNDGEWGAMGASLKLTVLPPFWKTKIAFTLYAVLIFGGLLLSRYMILLRARMKFQIEQERQEAHRMHELDMMKIKFFTNISHEFRTPLSLILTPLDKLVSGAENPAQRSHFLLIHRNARRLLNMVNQLLDFRKMEVQEVGFNPSEGDIVKFIQESVHSFSDLSEKKDIQLSFSANVQQLETFFDQDKLERILFNLLSNAFKFTPSHGQVKVELTHSSQNSAEETGKDAIEIKVIDTGIGIPREKHLKIFDRFFQSDTPRSMVNQGSGIGLSITREFVRIHGGTISVTSEPEKGSCFTIILPIKKITEAGTAHVIEEVVIVNTQIQEEMGAESHGNKKPVLLLVEDNEDFRFYLKDNLSHDYQILEGRNGKEGWNKALSQIPDLIVSDVMMPEMNGIELCKKVKRDPRISHIPVILLTARTSEDQKIEGFETGANDYITKPFNFEILQSRIRNLIAQQELLKKKFKKKIDLKVSDIEIASLDEKLILKAIKHVEDNISNTDFSVEDLSDHLAMSRVYLYKKLLSITGKTPLEFIRTIRLQRAAQLLKKSQLTVAEVAYHVGFNNPKYFTRYFKNHFNVLPSLYAEKENG